MIPNSPSKTPISDELDRKIRAIEAERDAKLAAIGKWNNADTVGTILVVIFALAFLVPLAISTWKWALS